MKLWPFGEKLVVVEPNPEGCTLHSFLQEQSVSFHFVDTNSNPFFVVTNWDPFGFVVVVGWLVGFFLPKAPWAEHLGSAELDAFGSRRHNRRRPG